MKPALRLLEIYRYIRPSSRVITQRWLPQRSQYWTLKRRTHTIQLDLLRSGSRSLITVHCVLESLEDLELLVSCASVSLHLLGSFNSRMTAIVYHVQYNNVRHLNVPPSHQDDRGGSEGGREVSTYGCGESQRTSTTFRGLSDSVRQFEFWDKHNLS